jgi:PIN domain nuclease of toxin-antitoxin system
MTRCSQTSRVDDRAHLTGQHAAGVAGLPSLHKDPFDRLLIAQATLEPMILVTNDAALAGYGSLVTVV